MNNGENTANTLHIQPLNDDLLANVSIEELEGRLEMQILHLTEAQICYDSCPACGPNCPTECTDCPTNCAADCPGLCEDCPGNCATLI